MSTESTPKAGDLTTRYRRNGKLQSCEPCRKSKLRCDHTLPVCGRCAKRRRGDQCFYHPHPLTQQTPRQQQSLSVLTPSPTPKSVTASVATSETDTSRPLPTDINIFNTSLTSSYIDLDQAQTTRPVPVPVPLPLPAPAPAPAPAPLQRAASAPPLDVRQESIVTANPGFQGLTSYSSIFAEGLGKIDGIANDLEVEYRRNVAIPHHRILQGCQVLSFLKDKNVVNRFVHRWYELSRAVWCSPLQFIVKEWLFRLWIHHLDVLVSQNPDKLRRLVEMIWRNTQTPLQFNADISPLDWARLGTGFHIRWEVIGIIAAVIGLCANGLDASDPFFAENKVSRRGLANKMLDVSDTCLEFCREYDSMDDLFMWLLFADIDLTSELHSDRSHHTYRAAGDLVSGVIAMGLHQKPKSNINLPFFLLEMRRRIRAAAYGIEISLASFLGRPPRLSYRYCHRDPPLDLTDSQLAMQGAELEAALAGLDENGYNIAQEMHRITWFKAYLTFGERREDVLDLALGDYTCEEVIRRAAVIEARCEAHWANLPAFVARSRNEAFDFRTMEPIEMLLRSTLRLASRANDMLLQRVLVRRAGAGPEKLVAAARLIFGDVLLITQRHDIASCFQMHFTGMLVSHGLRCAAIIAVELLRQEQRAQQQHQLGPQVHLLPRSKTIQDLAVFASRLGSVQEGDGSYDMCEQGRKVITGILDRILTPTPFGATATQAVCLDQEQHHHHLAVPGGIGDSDGQYGRDPTLEMPGVQANEFADVGFLGDAPLSLGNDDDFMSWLENMDWERTDNWPTF